MAVQSQKVTDNPNANTYFMVWNFKDTDNIKEAFQRVCALVSNLNNSAAVRFPNVRVSCVMGIGYNAWKKLELQEPLPKELDIFKEVKGRNIQLFLLRVICISISGQISSVFVLIWLRQFPMYYLL